MMEREKAEAAAAQARKDHDHYSLEVYGLGFSVCWSSADWLTQSTVWEALQKGDPHAPIPPLDPKSYPWSKDEKGSSGALPAYEAAIKEFPEKWEIPFLLAGPIQHNPEYIDDLKAGLGVLAQAAACTITGSGRFPRSTMTVLIHFLQNFSISSINIQIFRLR